MTNKHYFLVSYTAYLENKSKSTGCFNFNGDDRNINNKAVNWLFQEILEIVGDSNATPVITSISYLGCMTEEEFYDGK